MGVLDFYNKNFRAKHKSNKGQRCDMTYHQFRFVPFPSNFMHLIQCRVAIPTLRNPSHEKQAPARVKTAIINFQIFKNFWYDCSKFCSIPRATDSNSSISCQSCHLPVAHQLTAGDHSAVSTKLSDQADQVTTLKNFWRATGGNL